MANRRALVGYGVVLAVGTALAALVYVKSAKDYDVAIDNYRAASLGEAKDAARTVESALTQIYENLRTISFLPSVRKIDRHGAELDTDAHQSIQQIYNNLASAVAISEVYIVPESLDPERVDPATGEPEAPILMFDELIVGAHDAQAAGADAPADAQKDDANAPKEEEIYEYHLLVQQMAWLRANYPDSSKLDGMNLPFIAGPQVITCDNTDFDASRNDADRIGLVFSVPFYGADGKLKGTVSGIIRNKNLQGLLPAQDYALINAEYGYSALSREGGQSVVSTAAVSEAKADPALVFSATIPLQVRDPRSHWLLWAGHADARFAAGSDARAIRNFQFFAYGFAALLTLGGLAGWAAQQRHERRTRENEASLEQQLAEVKRLKHEREEAEARMSAEKSVAMAKLAGSFERSVGVITATISSAADRMHATAESMTATAERTSRQSTAVAAASDEASTNVQTVATASEELSASIAEIARQVSQSSTIAGRAVSDAERTNAMVGGLAEAAQKIGAVTSLINEIASQTNLLALNATIEAARAGEAGKGFAVVASEVKSLAVQTAKATEEIGAQIAAMQAATGQTVNAIGSIGATIRQIDEIATAIAAAVEEQGAATQEIARNVQQAATGTQEVSSNIVGVTRAAGETGAAAGEVLSAAEALSGQAAALRAQVDEFLAAVRAA